MIFAAGSPFDPVYNVLRGDPRVPLQHRPEPRDLHRPAHRAGDARPVPAHRQAGQVDDGDAAGAAGDQEAPGEVQERPRQAQRRDDEVLPGEQDQPARGLSAPPGADAGVLRAVPGDGGAVQAHPEVLRPVRGVLYRQQRAGCTRCSATCRSWGCRSRSTSSGWTCRSTPPRSPVGSSTRSRTSSSWVW